MYVALEADELPGSVTLTECDMNTRPDLSPWVSGVYVKPEARRQGVASALVRHAVQQAGMIGITRLYLYTNSARGLYEKPGSQVAGTEAYDRKLVTLVPIDVPQGS